MSMDKGDCTFEVTPEEWTDWTGRALPVSFMKKSTGRKDPVWECPFDAVGEGKDGLNKCVFHLAPEKTPDHVSAESKLMDVLDRHDGNDEIDEILFLGAKFGDLDIREERISLKAGITIHFDGSEFTGKTDFSSVKFDCGISFSGTEFKRSPDFSRAKFKGMTRFENVRVDADIDFSNSTFFDFTSFNGTHYLSEVDFSDAVFEDSADFRHTTFDDRSSFQRCRFYYPIFSGAKFRSSANFINAEFEVLTFMNEVEFQESVRFTSAEFLDEVQFDETIFGGYAKFRNTQFWGETTFIEAKFDDKVIFSNRGIFPYSQFHSKVDFSGTEFNEDPNFCIQYRKDGMPNEHTPIFYNPVDFSDVKFISGLSMPNLKTTGPIRFTGAEVVSSDLNNADLSDSEADFSSANLEGSDLRNSDFRHVNFENANLSETALYGADFSNASLHGTILSHARISNQTDFGIVGNTCLIPFVRPSPDIIYDTRSEPVYSDDAGVDNHTRAAAVYSEIEKLADGNSVTQLGRICHVWRKDMERKGYWNKESGGDRDRISWALSFISNVVVRYGESPYRVFGWAGVIIVLSGYLYWICDLLVSVGESTPSPSVVDAIYFSTLTFTTLGLGDYRPVDNLGRAVTIAEAGSGVILFALLVFVFGRRSTR